MKLLSNFFAIAVSAALLVSAAAVEAKEKPEWRSWAHGDRLRLSASIYRPQLDTEVGIGDENGVIGAYVSFEENLKLDSSKSIPVVEAEWRFFKRHSLYANYFDLKRSSFEQPGGGRIILGDEEIDIELPVAAFFDVRAVELAYAFSLIYNRKVDLSVGLGVSVQELTFGIQGTSIGYPGGEIPLGEIINERLEVTAPLPTFNIGFSYAFTDKFSFDSRIGYLALELDIDRDEDFEGRIINSYAGLRWKPFKHVGFLANYTVFDVDMEYQKRSAIGELNYSYKGPSIGIEAFF